VVAGLFVLSLAVWATDPDARRRWRAAVGWGVAVLAGGVVLILPFLVNFDPNARGFAILDEREPLGAFLRHNLVMYGALLWVVGALYLGRLRRARHRVRVVVFGAAIAVVGLSLLASAHLAGGAAVALLAAVALSSALTPGADRAERLLWLLVAGGLTCIAGAEIVYVRDEFDGTQFVRMNTLFKMGYQAWILLAIAGGVVLVSGRAWLPRIPRLLWRLGAIVLIGISLAFTVAGSDGRKAGFSDGPRLDGRAWLERISPGDVAAIDWLREHAPGDAVVLEAVGDDYSSFGNARISTYTGLQTVLGWQGHELQWSHTVGTRREDVKTLYTTQDEAVARELLERYRIRYVVVGPLERTTYGEPGVVVRLGREVFNRDGTAIYEYTPPPERRPRPAPKPARSPGLGG
jgi:YYY domain-containing protein